MAEVPTYHYLCSNGRGHETWSPKPLTLCPLWHLGEPCDGELKQVGGPKPKKTEEDPDGND